MQTYHFIKAKTLLFFSIKSKRQYTQQNQNKNTIGNAISIYNKINLIQQPSLFRLVRRCVL